MGAQARFVASLGALPLLAGCGGGHHAGSTTTQRPTVAAAIERRLTHAGYSIEQQPDRSALGGPASAQPVGEVAAFSIEVNFTSPNSFRLDITVFASHRDLLRTFAIEAAARKRAIKECARIPACRAFRRRPGFEQSPTLLQQSAQRVIGGVLYSAAVNSPTGKLSHREFSKVVALASGQAG